MLHASGRYAPREAAGFSAGRSKKAGRRKAEPASAEAGTGAVSTANGGGGAAAAGPEGGSASADGASEAEAEAAAFAAYAASTLARGGLPARHTPAELAALWADSLARPARLLRPFWLLRAALAGPIETFILLDRAQFLAEQGGPPGGGGGLGTFTSGSPGGTGGRGGGGWADVRTVPLFDPLVSPRNVALYARRP